MIKKILLLIFLVPFLGNASIRAGLGKSDITPPSGTPSAGYSERKGMGMQGTHDSLLAIALFLDNGEKKIIFCSVDHLGLPYDITQEIIQKVKQAPGLIDCDIYIGSSHSHSAGGAYLNIPLLGKSLAGDYNPDTVAFYIKKTVESCILSSQNTTLVKVGIGYGHAENISKYRGTYPIDVSPLSDVAVIKITRLDDSPFAVLFNYPIHPTILRKENLLFSSDFVGYARDNIQNLLGSDVQPLYFNGAQGDIIPKIEDNSFVSCELLGKSLALTVQKIWESTKARDTLQVDTEKKNYSFTPLPTPSGLLFPIDTYSTEINLIVLNRLQAFITVPGELSCLYDKALKKYGLELGYEHVSILGLVNDAHGYIILPESWKNKTFESHMSFGGENYGETVRDTSFSLLKNHTPKTSCKQN